MTAPLPVAVFAYNRADKLRAMFGSLERCAGFAEADITIFVDGPRSPADAAGVDEVRRYVEGLAHPRLRAVFSPVNLGLRQSIYRGVSRVLEEHDRVVVLEDDLVLSPAVLAYFREFLARHAADPDIWAICAYQYDAPALRGETRAVALPYASPWGWATWRDRWQRFELDSAPPPDVVRTRAFRRAFDFRGYFPFSYLLELSTSRMVSSWFIHWQYTIHRAGGKAVFPPRRLVDNDGVNAGTHATRWNPRSMVLSRPDLMQAVPDPVDPSVDPARTLARIRPCRELRLQRLISMVGYWKRRLRRR